MEEPRLVEPQRPTVLVAIFLAGLIGGVIGGTFPQWSQNLPPSLRGRLPQSQTQPSQRPNFTDDRKVVTNVEEAVINVVKTSSPAVVSIVAKSVDFDVLSGPVRSEQGIGTGFIVDATGIVITNNHVVDNRDIEYTVYTKDKKSYKVEKIDQDPTNDTAILKISGTDLPVLELGNSDNIQVGQTVVAIGNALGRFDNTVTTGVVSGIGRGVTASDQFGQEEKALEGVLQTDAALNPGNSGGPLLNLDSKVVGVNFAVTTNAQNIGFVIPINKVKPILDGYKQTGNIQRAYLGVGFRPIGKELAQLRNLPEGAFISQVASNSPAAKASLRQGDIITKLGGEAVDDGHSLDSLITKHKPSDQVDIELYRDGNRQTVKATLEQAPARL